MGARLGIISLVFLGIAACAPPDWVGDAPPPAEVPEASASPTDEPVTTENECARTPDACKPRPTAPSSEPAPAGTPTGGSTGSTSTAPSGAPAATSCCGKKGTCVPSKSVPEDDREDLEQKECAEGQLCAPNEHLDAGFSPPSCKGDVMHGSYDGVCLSNCLSFDFFASMVTGQGTCDADHRCIPCTTAFGIPTGAPGCR